ncbi:MAG: hypothetical protein V1667_02950 [bacterium]
MNYIIKIFEKAHLYFVLCAIGVAAMYLINYVGVDFFNLNPRLVYSISTCFNLFISFFGNSKIFGCSANRSNLLKFIAAAVFFFFAMNFLFYVFTVNLNINYLLAITINFMIFPLVKFLSYKYYVFKQ